MLAAQRWQSCLSLHGRSNAIVNLCRAAYEPGLGKTIAIRAAQWYKGENAAELLAAPNGVAPGLRLIDPTFRLPPGFGSMSSGGLRSANDSAKYVILLAALTAAAAGGGCTHGVHAESAQKSKPAEPETVKAAVLVMEPTSWPTVVRTQGSLIADEV